jgi:hypothetical protein
MRYIWMLLLGVLCLALAGCPEKEADDNVVNDQEGMRGPGGGDEVTPAEEAAEENVEDAIGDENSVTPGTPGEGDAAAPPADGTAPPADGTAPPADGTEPPADGTEPPADGTEPPAEGTEPPADGTDPPAEGTTP